MVRFIGKAIILNVFIIAMCNATPAKSNKIRTSNNRFLARQEAADDDVPSQTPYPQAGIRPDIPFDLPTEEKLSAPVNHYLPPSTDPAMFYSAPSEVYGPPAKTYGPPDASEESASEVPQEEMQTESIQEEATTEGNNFESIENKSEEVPNKTKEENLIPERIVLSKSTSSIRASRLKQFSPNSPKTNKPQQFYLINGMLYTVA